MGLRGVGVVAAAGNGTASAGEASETGKSQLETAPVSGPVSAKGTAAVASASAPASDSAVASQVAKSSNNITSSAGGSWRLAEGQSMGSAAAAAAAFFGLRYLF